MIEGSSYGIEGRDRPCTIDAWTRTPHRCGSGGTATSPRTEFDPLRWSVRLDDRTWSRKAARPGRLPRSQLLV